jgi:hypothetical protein
MNTAVAPVEPKKVVSVEILHLDELGYGPQGKHTRREWRAECLQLITANFKEYNFHRDELINQDTGEIKPQSFQFLIIYDDGTKSEGLNPLTKNYVPYALDLIGYEFDNPLMIDGRIFNMPLLFLFAKFRKWVKVTDAQFGRTIDFTYAQFFDWIAFDNVALSGNAIFGYAKFHTFSDFSKFKVGKIAHFRGVEFVGSTKFSEAKFSGNANFIDVKFHLGANFSDVEFFENASFSSALFANEASFRSAKFNKQCRFDNFPEKLDGWSEETTFLSKAEFENASFRNVGHFERVRFINFIPSFLGVDNATTRLEFSGDEYFAKNDVSEDAINRLGLLKRLADEHGQIDQAMRFNALELRAKSKTQNAGLVFKLVTNLYELFSNYGRSFFRPIVFYFLLIWLGFLYSFGYSVNLADISEIHKKNCASVSAEQKLDLSRERAAIEYALFRAGGLLDFTDTGKQNNAVNCRLFEEPIEPPIMRAWGIFKGIASIALLFLAALGLRNKYRIK